MPASEIVRIAQDVVPTFQKRFDTCTLRLKPQGGRSCEACALLLEERLHKMEGIHRATASYVGGVLSVTYDNALLSPVQIAERTHRLGVSVAPSAAEAPPAEIKPFSRAWFTDERLEALFALFTFIGMAGGFIAEQLGYAPTVPFVTALYALAYAFGGFYGLKGGLESLRHGAMDIDLLMVLAAVGAWLVGAPFEGAMLLFLFSLSNVLQAYAMDRTRNAIRALMKLRPKEALTRRGVLPIERIVVGDVLLVRPGERIAMDGVVIEGESAVDQASITGESMPVSKRVGIEVLAGTINTTGGLEVRVTKLAKDSTLAKMIKLVEEAHSEKAKTQRWIDKFEQYYAWAVIVFTGLLIVIPPLVFNENFDGAFYRAMTAMVAASPCALVISTPASILSAIGNGARRGVLFKGGVHLEQAATIKVVALDKTGTLTEGKPQVIDVHVLPAPAFGWNGTADELLSLAGAVEAKSEHPLARAICTAAHERQLQLPEASAFQAQTGKGVRATVHGQEIHIGSVRYFESFADCDLSAAQAEVQRQQDEGKTSVVIARRLNNGAIHALGVIGIADVLRTSAASAVRALKAAGVERVVMLTGDNARTARAIATQAGLDDFYADLLPEDKVRLVKEIKEKWGPLAMVGDGVNDAPALATATIGIAMGAAGTDVALETADIVLMADDLHNLAYVMALSRATRQTLIMNLGFALLMIGLMLVSIFAVALPLPLAVVGHEGGTVLVSLNGLRLLGYKFAVRS
jgi:Cd2+/Zn2+-exporting ATPase